MESVVATMLAMLEMSFIFVALGLLHSLRNVIGKAPFYIAIGLLYVFAQFICAAELKVVTGVIGFDFYIGRTVIFLPLLGALMLVYITDGTLATQQIILGALTALGLFLYLGGVTLTQCNWEGYSITQGITADTLNFLISQSRKTMSGATLSMAVDLFLLPIFFQRLRNMGGRLFFCVLGAMMFTQLADTFIYMMVTFWNKPNWWIYINSSFFIKALAITWISSLIVIYLKRIETEKPGEDRSALDIVFAFFGGYHQARKLERDLEHWEGRFKLVVDNALEMILIIDPDGVISDVNQAALKILQSELEPLSPYPMRLSGHGAFHSPIMQAISTQARASLEPALFAQIDSALIDGRGNCWQPWATDPVELWDYTLGEQITKTYNFTLAVQNSVKEFAPDHLILLGPGNSLGAVTAQSLIDINWLDLGTKQDFSDRQESNPFILSMGLESQRSLCLPS